ncbi:hypothetical protein AB0M43_01250 [Longispora sp. NPDC051575]|uniref:hypothetical protein n=1 Tax=Longispora sp. NPDC051575 TaxID=3154943 RepID=UPI00341BBEFA
MGHVDSRTPSRKARAVHAAWRAAVLVRVTRLRSMLEEAHAPGPTGRAAESARSREAWAAGVTNHLDAAQNAARTSEGGLGRLVVWWTGSDVEAAWLNLHAAEELLLRSGKGADTDWLARVYQYARTFLGDNDPNVRYLSGQLALPAGTADTGAKTATVPKRGLWRWP